MQMRHHHGHNGAVRYNRSQQNKQQNKAIGKMVRHFLKVRPCYHFLCACHKRDFPPDMHQDQWHCITGGMYFI